MTTYHGAAVGTGAEPVTRTTSSTVTYRLQSGAVTCLNNETRARADHYVQNGNDFSVTITS